MRFSLTKRKLVSKNQWEEQYKSGGWSFLKNINEYAHYSIITGYISYLNKNRALLDVGCGEGVLQERLSTIGGVGIFFSA